MPRNVVGTCGGVPRNIKLGNLVGKLGKPLMFLTAVQSRSGLIALAEWRCYSAVGTLSLFVDDGLSLLSRGLPSASISSISTINP